MKRIALIAFAVSALFLLVPFAHCQGTATLTGTITDSDSIAWADATWTATASNPGGGQMINRLTGAVVPNSVTGVLDSTGAFQSDVITRTDDIIPAGVTWVFKICSDNPRPFQKPQELPKIAIMGSSAGPPEDAKASCQGMLDSSK